MSCLHMKSEYDSDTIAMCLYGVYPSMFPMYVSVSIGSGTVVSEYSDFGTCILYLIGMSI